MENFTSCRARTKSSITISDIYNRSNDSFIAVPTDQKFETTTISNTTVMKSTTTTLRGLVMLALLTVLTTLGYGQNFECYIDNDQSTPNTYEFDIKVKASSGTIKFNGFQ